MNGIETIRLNHKTAMGADTISRNIETWPWLWQVIFRSFAAAPELALANWPRRWASASATPTIVCARSSKSGWSSSAISAKNPSKGKYADLLIPAGLAEKTRAALATLKRKEAEFEAFQCEIEVLGGELESSKPERH